ncbi:hypothetical protein COL5a_012093 [Colletotrichum fioriniae]|nr:hypothetical protein COL5a_012093 [Colletotrichum fioriniae]
MATAEQFEAEKPKHDEWIHVKSKSRSRRSAPKPPVKGPGAISKPAEPRSHKSVIDITAEYHSFKSKWRETICCLSLKKLVRDNFEGHRRVRKAVCLGVGTFDPEDGGWDAKRRSYIQLDAFLTVVEVLCMPTLSCRNTLYQTALQALS